MLLIFLLNVVLSSIQTTHSSVCRSMRIQNLAEGLKKLDNCTVVEGFLEIVLMQLNNLTHFEPFSFPHLRDITEYLLVYDVSGLRSVGKLLPNLERIGGEVLFSEETALAIVNIPDLEEVGLYSLREITRGSVTVMRNPRLRYLNTIDWKQVMKWDAASTHFYKNSDLVAVLPECPKTCPLGFCWSSDQCQLQSEAAKHACHPECLGSCRGPSASDCHTCKGVVGPGSVCMKRCPPNTFQLQYRRCVSRAGCNSYWHIDDPRRNNGHAGLTEKNYTYVVFKDKCLKSCPAEYERNSARTDCVVCPLGKCESPCAGGIINSVEDAHKFTGCIYIKGSIGIHIKHEITQTVREELEEGLGSIERINGYLKVARSSLTDLKFLRNLEAVEGNGESYALYVVENQNIQELWDWSTKKKHITVRGKLFFHYNPKLCLQIIYNFLEISGYELTDSDFEVGKDSNGDKNPCNASKATLTVDFVSFDLLRVRIPHVQDNDSSPFRYTLYYTKDTFQNLTIFEDLDPCSDNGWKTVDKSDLYADNLVTLTGLEPDTQYVCYFTTYSGNRIEARSKMTYVSTLPSKPSELSYLQASSNCSSQIYLQWQPPKHVNGKLQEYVVTWDEFPNDKSILELRDYCMDPMEFPTVLRPHEEKIPKSKNVSSECIFCYRDVHIPKEGFGQLCKNFQHFKFPISFKEKLKYSSCESYFYSYIFESPFCSVSRENQTAPEISRPAPNELFRRNDELHTSESKPLINTYPRRKIQQGSMKIVPGNVLETVISDLKHFSTYVVTVKACRERSPQELNTSEENRCSNVEIVITRTQKSHFADNITTVNYTVSKQTLTMHWRPPTQPNGIVLAFEIEFKRKGHDSEKNSECIGYSNNVSRIITHSITGIRVGKYEFRIRAVSMSGKGLFTNFHFFEVLDDVAYSELELLFLIVVILMFSLAVVSLSHCLTRKRYKAIDSILVAECNPNYHYSPDPAYEIQRENVDFGEEIGVGTFGKVYTGVLRPENRRCAIKTMIENASAEMESSFLREADFMKSLNKANFVVKLLGVVSKESPHLVLMELMELGDLKNYLRSTRETQPLGNATMIRMAIEIADAMTFMEAHKFVHRDLAARNCMVGEDLTIKVGDFGMARNIYETDYYRKTGQELLPIRWMAPESLKDGEFSSLSDVWSYGIALWEIVSKGEQPYHGLSNEQVLQEVIKGTTLEQPSSCPRSLGDVMVRCWKCNPHSRVTFMEIMLLLNYYHSYDDEFKRLAYYYTPEAEKIRNPKYVEMQPFEEPLLRSVD